MADILKEIIKVLPANKISDAAYEAANIVLYTKDKDYFLAYDPSIINQNRKSKVFNRFFGNFVRMSISKGLVELFSDYLGADTLKDIRRGASPIETTERIIGAVRRAGPEQNRDVLGQLYGIRNSLYSMGNYLKRQIEFRQERTR